MNIGKKVLGNMTNFILVRHCQANGQEPEAQLTTEGLKQANELAGFLKHYNVSRIISSPFTRAIQTITPYATNKNIEIELDKRLKERILSSENLPDWFNKLQQTFQEPDLKFSGGESSNEARKRILDLVDDLMHTDCENIVLVTHGNLAALLLNYISQNFGFEEWKQLSNPDVYLIELKLNELSYKRIWK